jgi:uncharacterized protein YfaS (alpha-2-macroglobulin family)
MNRLLGTLLALVTAGAVAAAPQLPPGKTLRRPVGRKGTVVVPDHFLRRWDPLTIFFERDIVPAVTGQLELEPERFAALEPAHPGAWEWLTPRTLQFRPADPWPALTEFRLRVGENSRRLVTLMDPPRTTIPSAGAIDLEPVERLTLRFADTLDPAVLAEMVRVELRPDPGVDGVGAQWLGAADFTVKVLERRDPSQPAGYQLDLRSPIPPATRALVHLRLAPEGAGPGGAEGMHTFGFRTAPPFRVVRAGVSHTRLPLTPSGTAYPESQALEGNSGWAAVVLEFSRPPVEVGPMAARSLVRFDPPVDGISATMSDGKLVVTGSFRPAQLYRASVVPTELRDDLGRSLEMAGESSFYFHFPSRPSYLRWSAGHGVLERFGPQMVPIEGRGDAAVDLRIYPLDPLDRGLWPFPSRPVEVNEGERPPGPGEEHSPHSSYSSHVNQYQLVQALRLLGAPPVSKLVELPLGPDRPGARFGLDLAPHLAELSGKEAPGTYLVGIRRLGAETTRSWLRVQVTDLVLTTLELPEQARFQVTSMSTGEPVPGARVVVEGSNSQRRRWETFFDSRTDSAGMVTWPQSRVGRPWSFLRVRVEYGKDHLVLDPRNGPDRFHRGSFVGSGSGWLQTGGSRPSARPMAHIYTERPVYRPGEAIHVAGFLRYEEEGELRPVKGDAEIVVQAPGGRTWRHRTKLSMLGSFHHTFQEEGAPTGSYVAWVESGDLKNAEHARRRWATQRFRVEAYRVPRFQVDLHAAREVPLDRPFEVSLSARYYAGGKVSGRPVHWSVTRSPLTWTPGKARPGFVYSSDARYSRSTGSSSTSRTSEGGVTDADGSATLELDPSGEGDARPRLYTVEATVTGADDQTVSSTARVRALPPFVLALKAPRYLEQAGEIPVEVLVVGADGEPVVGKTMTVRLKKREWHSHLREGDFAAGEARWVTDSVDTEVHVREASSTKDPLKLALPADGAGVYLVEVEAADEQGRVQVVTLDLYAGGDKPVSWKKPESKILKVRRDQPSYAPGETARLVAETPFQTGHLMVVVEEPTGIEVTHLPVRDGKAVVSVPLQARHVPRLPVHLVLWRGRLPGEAPGAGGVDLGKPATLAATEWIEVRPVSNRVEVTVDSPARAVPGEKIQVKLTLKDPSGKPVAGEVALWLVDQAVLALGKEQRLDPLPDFLPNVDTYLHLRDTRGLGFGYLPFAELPGGDDGYGAMADMEMAAPMASKMARRARNGFGLAGAREAKEDEADAVTVRKNFKSVPVFEPRIEVGPSGEVTVPVQLPDNLTTFMIRVKALSGPQRFGSGTGRVAVRLPLVVQPALPRFVRPGDIFEASAVSRIVEGDGGAGTVTLEASGLRVTGEARQMVALAPGVPARANFEVEVRSGEDAARRVKVKMVARRSSDGAADAFEVIVPVRPDRRPERRRRAVELKAGRAERIPGVADAARPGSVRRRVRVSDRAELVRAAAALDAVLEYPHGCTEQRVAKARAVMAAGELRELLSLDQDAIEHKAAVEAVLEWLPTALRSDGLVSYWPGASGYVSLTAWVFQFLVDAEAAGFRVDQGMKRRLVESLKRSLRSDYSQFVDGGSFHERCQALAALASADELDEAYAAELARRAAVFGPEPMADVTLALARSGDVDSYAARHLRRELWNSLVFQLHQGQERFAGFQEAPPVPGLLIPSQARTLGRVLRALVHAEPASPRLKVLLSGLVDQAGPSGWGSTNANAAALQAVVDAAKLPSTGGGLKVRLEAGGRSQDRMTSAREPLLRWESAEAGPLEVELVEGGKQPVTLLVDTTYMPAEPGSKAAPVAEGFVVERRWLKVDPEGGPPTQVALAGGQVEVKIGDVIEEHVRVVNPEDRHFVAVEVPLAAGMEPMNPELATAGAIARPANSSTRSPDYQRYLDEKAAFYFDALPKGTYDIYFRTRATVVGRFVQPPARAEMMYQEVVQGHSSGTRVAVSRDAR